jgi:hypothetical protein
MRDSWRGSAVCRQRSRSVRRGQRRRLRVSSRRIGASGRCVRGRVRVLGRGLWGRRGEQKSAHPLDFWGVSRIPVAQRALTHEPPGNRGVVCDLAHFTRRIALPAYPGTAPAPIIPVTAGAHRPRHTPLTATGRHRRGPPPRSTPRSPHTERAGLPLGKRGAFEGVARWPWMASGMGTDDACTPTANRPTTLNLGSKKGVPERSG